MTFALDLKRFSEKAGAKADSVVRKVAIDILSSIVLKSPVDTGRFRGAWQTNIGSVNYSTATTPDKSGQGAINAGIVGLAAFNAGSSIYITNSLPYAERLESGYSKQAPAGMVRLTQIEFQRFVQKALKE